MQTTIYNSNQEVSFMDNKIKEIRTERGMSVSELARRTGLSRTAIFNIENGKSNPLATSIQAISVVLDKEPNDIFLLIL